MRVTYQNNFEKLIKKIDEGSSKLKEMNFDSEVFPHHHMLYSFYPYAEKYASIFTNVNLYEIANPRQIEFAQFLFVRDGGLTLVDFFNRFPTPKDLKTILIIHLHFASFVPDSWQENILFYELELNSLNVNSEPRNKLLIHGLLIPQITDLPALDERIQHILNEKKIDQVVYATQSRKNFFLQKENEDDASILLGIEWAFKLRNKLNLREDKIVFAKPLDAQKIPDLKNYMLVNTISKAIYYVDDYNERMLIGNGALPWKFHLRKSPSLDDRIIYLNQYSGVRIVANLPDGLGRSLMMINDVFKVLDIRSEEKLSPEGFRFLIDFIPDHCEEIVYNLSS